MTTASRLSMLLGGAIFSLPAMRQFRSDTTLHPQVEERVHELLASPPTAQVVYCIPLGYPQGGFGPHRRKPLPEACAFTHWETPAPWDD